MKKIAVIGISGSGKTTLSRFISQALHVPHIEMDRLVWLSEWAEETDDALCDYIADIVSNKDGWVIDGNYDRKLGDVRKEIYKKADEVVWIDLPLHVTIYQLIKRVITDLVTARDLFNGNRQSLRLAFGSETSLVPYAIKSHFLRRKEIPTQLASLGITATHLQSHSDIKKWMSKIAYS